MIKKILGSFFLILVLGLFLLLTFIFYDKQRLSLEDLNVYENVVMQRGTTSSEKDQKVFYFKLYGLEEKMGVYRKFKNYDNLLNNINVGDRLKIYYIPTFDKRENINIDVVQIDKNEENILSKSEYQIKYRLMMIVFACICIIYYIFCLIKYGEVENIIPSIF